jgi:hypothetical protein
MTFEMASLPWQEIELVEVAKDDDIRKGMTFSTAAVELLAESRKVPFIDAHLFGSSNNSRFGSLSRQSSCGIAYS